MTRIEGGDDAMKKRSRVDLTSGYVTDQAGGPSPTNVVVSYVTFSLSSQGWALRDR